MFNFGALAANVLNSLDNAAKDTLEEPRISATALRSQRQGRNNTDGQQDYQSEEEDNAQDDIASPEVQAPLVKPPSPSNNSLSSSPRASRSVEKLASPPSSATKKVVKEKIHANDYALSFESAANSSNVSNDGDHAAADGVEFNLRDNISSSQLSEAGEPFSIAINTPFTADIDEQPVSVPSTPVTKSAKQVETAEAPETITSTATPAAPAPAAAAATLLGSIVNTIGSAKKLASTPAPVPPSAPTSAVDADKAGKDNKDKEILLLKKTLKKKNAEIEKLNRECLDLEEHSSALKLEVQEAWSNYKTSQEKAAAVESELQDEIRQIQKAKLTDKQISVAQLSKMGEEVAEAMRQVAAAQAQRAEVQSKYEAAVSENASWEERLAAVQEELAQAQTGTVQGVTALREELRVMQLNTEQMRVDHSSLLRQNQLRQAELERENSELVASLTQQQKELQRLQHQNSTSSAAYSTLGGNRDYVTLQQELIDLTAAFEKERDRGEDLDRRLRITEREARAAQMTSEDEKRRNLATIDELGAKIADLESKNNARRVSNKSASGGNTGFLVSAGSVQDGAGTEDDQAKYAEHMQYATNNTPTHSGGGQSNQLSVMDYESTLKELHDQRQQSQNLSKLLLKKQGTVLELQAERSALKSRLIDMQARCSEAERQLASMRDLEGGDYNAGGEGNDDVVGESSATSGAGGLLRRGNNGTGGRAGEGGLRNHSSRDTKVISDLERFGVKPGASVTRAVNMIDTWTIVTGRFLRVYPLARLGFVFYLLLLHMWVLFILVMQTHSLELDTDPHEQVLHS